MRLVVKRFFLAGDGNGDGDANTMAARRVEVATRRAGTRLSQKE
jgi:hypothetical protein